MRRCLSIILAILMAVGSPMTVLAENTDTQAHGQGEVSISCSSQEMPDNEELFDVYITHMLQESLGMLETMGDAAGDRLKGDTKVFYNEIKSHIKRVASGESIAVDFTTLDNLENLSWTAAELGVTDIVKNGQFTEEAMQSLKEKLLEKIDFSAIFDCLLADCPYDLYWFDKSTEGAFRYGYSVSGNNGMIWITKLSFTFAVAEAYKDSDGLVDNSKVTYAKDAISNAEWIVDYYASESDDNKLASYADEILNRVSYNHSAADNDNTPYGDPWQIIYVFDDDSSTNVVCEGYSKAFQYLCDMSQFNDDITCHSVSGIMTTDDDGGNHMWNLIDSSNGRYLVDLTNCDEGTIGAPDKLYMVCGEPSANGRIHTFNVNGFDVIFEYETDIEDLICDGYPVLGTTDNTVVDSGSCGTDLTWQLTNDGLLSISGSGAMTDNLYLAHRFSSTAPWYEYREQITALSLDNNITHIGDYAFTGLSNITGELKLPENIVTIGDEAFGGCVGLKGRLVLPENLTSIGDFAFSDCGFTGKLNIPDKVTIIGMEAFKNCSGFTGSLQIPDSVEDICSSAFENCTGLDDEVLFGNSVDFIGENAFTGCDDIPGFRFTDHAPVSVESTPFGSSAGKVVYYPEGSDGWSNPWHGYTAKAYQMVSAYGTCGDNLTWSVGSFGLLKISGSGAMYDYSGYENPDNLAPWNDFVDDITMIVLDDAITYIGDYAFLHCSSVEGRLTLPLSLTAIGDGAFAGCSEMVGDLIIPEGVTAIGDDAFESCGFTGKLSIPSTVVTIGEAAFFNCKNLKGDLIIPDSVSSIGQYAFGSCKSMDGTLSISKNITVIPNDAFELCYDLSGRLVLPSGLTEIGKNAFNNCESFTGELIIPDGVTIIDSNAFSNCWGLSGDLTIPDSVTKLMPNVFNGCMGMDGKLTLPKNITSIPNYAFNQCKFKGDLVIPAGVKSIGYDAFFGCDFSNGTLKIPSSVLSIGEYAFSGCNFTGQLVIPGAVTIDRYAFSGCDDFEGTLLFGSGIKTLGAGAFQNCTGFDDVMFPGEKPPTSVSEASSTYATFPSDLVLKFPESATGWSNPWYGYTTQMVSDPAEGLFGDLYWSLDDDGVLTISGTGKMLDAGGVDDFPWYVHKDSITGLVLEEGITSVAYYAFHNYSGLDGDITIPSTVTRISDYAFEGCTGVDRFIFAGNGPQVVLAYKNNRSFCKTAVLYYNKKLDYWKNYNFETPNYWCGYQCYPIVTVIGSGTYGKGFGWTYTDDGVLNIAGKGDMQHQDTASAYPWYEHMDEITEVRVADGVTGIPDYAFEGFEGIASVVLPDTLSSIGCGAFNGCTGISKFEFAGNAPATVTRADEPNPSFPSEAVLSYKCGATGWSDPVWNGYTTVGLGHNVVIDEAMDVTCTVDGFTEGKHCSICKMVFVQQEIIPSSGHNMKGWFADEGGHWEQCETCKDKGEIIPHVDGNDDSVCDICETELIPIPAFASGTLQLNKKYLLMQLGETYELTADGIDSPVLIEWSVEDVDVVKLNNTNGQSVTFTAVGQGTTAITATVMTFTGIQSVECRIDVTEEFMPEIKVHAGVTSVTSNIYSVDQPNIEIVFDLPQNMYTAMGVDTVQNTGNTVEYAYFAKTAANDNFMLRVKDDRTLVVIPTVDVNDAKAVKALKSSYKSPIVICVDGVEITTIESVTVKVDKKLPTIKVKDIKFNSFYTGQTLPLVFTSNKGNVLSAEQGTNPKGNAVPDWLTLNSDMTVKLDDDVTKKNGKLYLNVNVDGCLVPVSVTAKVSAASTAPKIKLSGSKVVFNVDRSVSTYNYINVVSGDKKVSFESLGILSVDMISVDSMTSKNKKTYAANDYYEIVGYNTETGQITLGVKDGKVPIKGKILLGCTIEDGKSTVNLPLSVEIYKKAPVIKLQKTSGTLNYNLGTGIDMFKTKVTFSPADYRMEDLDIRVYDKSGKNELSDVLDVAYADGYITVRTTNNTSHNTTYKVKIGVLNDDSVKKVTLSVNTLSLTKGKMSVTLTSKGSFDTSKLYNSSLTLTPKYKNFNANTMPNVEFEFIAKNSKSKETFDVTDQFLVIANDDGTYTVKVKQGEYLNPSLKYSLTMTSRIGTAECSTKALSFTVKQGTVKFNQSKKEIMLYKNDRFSEGKVTLTVNDLKVMPVEKVTLKDSEKSSFELEQIDDTSYMIGFKNNSLTKKTKSGSVTLEVWLEGNTTTKPNATVKVSVKVLAFK